MRYDVIIVGAGPAGTAAAYDLAAARKRVLLIDRRRFPRTKPCAGGVTIKALRRLRYSISPVVRQLCTELVLGKRLEATSRFRGPRPMCAMTVRAELDHYCLQRTIERGAEFQVVPHVEAIEEATDQVTVRTAVGAFHADFLVGADGANSVVARLVPELDSVSRGFAIEAQVMGRDLPPMEFDFGVAEFGYGWLFPKRDHINIGLYTNAPGVRLGRADLLSYATHKLGTIELHEVVGHHIGLRGWEGRIATARVALAGDAAGLVDPLLGEGIHNAVASGQAAASAIIAAHAQRRPLAEVYAGPLRPILDDLRTSYRAASRFYGNLELGYRALTSRVVSRALLHGYARGLTFTQSRNWFFLMPFLPYQPTETG